MKSKEFYKTNRSCKKCKKEYLPILNSGLGKFCSSNCKSSYDWDKRNPWITKKCQACNENTFKVRKGSSGKKYCNRKCRSKMACMFEKDRMNNEKHFIKNEFSEKKEEYGENLINYPQSPTGKAYIGFAKQPLMPNKNGIGFQGVKLQSENRELIQCSGCGRWLMNITTRHTMQCLKVDLKGYKKMFGLNAGTALVSDKLSNYYSSKIVHCEAMVKNYTNPKEVRQYKEWRHRFYQGVTMEKMNLLGTCPDQLKDRMIKYIKRFHKIPSGTRGKDGFNVNTYKYRFGTLNNALKAYGLPTRTRLGSHTEYIFPDGKVYMMKFGMGYEELYTIMVKKCPILQKA